MNDLDRTAEKTAATTTRMRPLLWLVLIVSVAANVTLSSVLDNPWAGSAFGALALACGVTLAVNHYRNR
ncbi:hypothetical protein AB0F95_06375 [Micromonospora tulbaghiae]|uniref:Holin n=1 Tax=Micromonospora tulbaghiae TaxID=479978 RepID=A0AAW4J9Y7_9ACTN|nr:MULTISPECIES: hypothetical protein [Micromonospora]KAB1901130.1 hypothetical protein F8279_28365 [Micromonospora sp. AMSO1212t]MBO4138788.1 hypothetical protein [Micromonospora tulbaghiae]MDX5461552.1 hypothetical protein [Micromonospora tulbaghiae]SCF01844.1 hypothetical protein GA0070562_5227 [Micromonospora tulbaghiae]